MRTGGYQEGAMNCRAKNVFLTPVIIFLSARLYAAPNFAPDKGDAPHWSYSGPEGPEHWGDLDPAFALCKNGKEQSPIDAREELNSDLQPIHFEYGPVPLKIVNNGHTIQINVKSGGGITIDGAQYQLVQFHFHKPSEEAIDGKHFDMVAHLVHQDVKGKLAVVAVLLKSGKENPILQSLWNNLPADEGEEHAPANVAVNVASLLPANQNYYTFAGSLTTPPCSEGVTWYVLKSPVQVSPAQIAVFGKLFPMNARPIQPTNSRQILESGFKK
jgi:carbonic anhydrase